MTLASPPGRTMAVRTPSRTEASRPLLPSSRVTRVLIADAHPVMGVGIRALVAATPDLQFCGMVHTAQCALERARSTRPNLMVLDSSLDMAATGVRALRRGTPSMSVVALVENHNAAVYLPTAARVGVHAVLRRSAHPSEIIAAIRAARSGRVVIDPILARCASSALHDEAALSDRQVTVLTLIARGHGTTVIAQTMGIAAETVRTHVKSIMRCLGVHDRAHAVARGYELGILTPIDTHRTLP